MAKICIVSPSLKLGGIERQLVLLAKYFVTKNHQVYFISCLKHNKFYKLDKKVVLIEPSFKRTTGTANKLFFYPKLIFFIRKQVKLINPDTVLTFGDGLSSRVLLALLGFETPVYISDRTSPNFKLSPVVKIMKSILYPKATAMIAQTNYAANIKKSQFKNKLKIKVIPNILEERKKYNIEKKDIILYVGRLSWEKGPKRLIESFAKIHSVNNGWKLVLAGSGPMLEELKEFTKHFKIEKNVEFLGDVKAIDKLYAQAKIFAIPSHFEGFPNSLIEAMASGLACLSFDSYPVDEIITHNKNGLIVKDDDLDAFANSMQKLISNNELRLRLGETAKEIAAKLSVEVIGKSYENLILNK
ncbi:glycosyltransferase [Psychroflexus montanilacus]|uniref:glycosyltransferase n=1 Tax=Psychroflexus montanilacus TaxID=2873598 RepID=UPI001CCA5182|nr:glycosyltransferase [Psychroflexus montanilacus]MBZ9652569.1 glycosyltransferase [Psychroflexus montanilacus]